MKIKFYTEFEFETSFGNICWFPLFLLAADEEEATKLTQSVINGISQNNELIKHKKPVPLISNSYSEFIDKNVQQRLSGKAVYLEMDIWKFRNLETDLNLSFDDHFKLIEHESDLTERTIATMIKKYHFPVRVYKSDLGEEFNEFLLLNVVSIE